MLVFDGQAAAAPGANRLVALPLTDAVAPSGIGTHERGDSIPAPNDTRARGPRVSVVIPAMNEERNIGWVLGRMPAGLHEMILVDGRSKDDTVAVARQARPDILVIEQQSRGKGAAVAAGLTAVTGDIAVMIDADGSMDPAEIPALVGALLAGADVVKGSRAISGGGSQDLSTLRKAGNRGLTSVANRIYGQSWRELCYGYAAFWTDVLPLLGVHQLAQWSAPNGVTPLLAKPSIAYGHGFEIEAVLFCRAARARLRVAEVFSFEHPRRHGASNLATWRDGWRVLTAVMKERHFQPTPRLARHLRSYPVVPALHATDRATR